MSRIGKNPVVIPSGVNVNISGNTVKVKGPKGELSFDWRDAVSVAIDGAEVKITRRDDSREAKSLHGLTRTLIDNMVKGVSEGFEKKLEIVGVGYKAEAKGKTVVLNLGFSNPINYTLPKGIVVAVEKQTSVTVSGADKQMVGQVAAELRGFRPPEPYKGKGVKYAGEHIRRKAGKAGKGAGG